MYFAAGILETNFGLPIHTYSKSVVCRWKMPSLTRSRVYISRFKPLLSVHPKEMGLQGL